VVPVTPSLPAAAAVAAAAAPQRLALEALQLPAPLALTLPARLDLPRLGKDLQPPRDPQRAERPKLARTSLFGNSGGDSIVTPI